MSVCLITYNHRDYVGAAVESILAQKTTFPIEVVVGEDASTDGTREVVASYQARYPGIIQPLSPVEKRGIAGNIRAALAACRGRYVALLEGDDYWTAPSKLERQVDALESRPDHALCFHPVQFVSQPPRADLEGKLLPERAPGSFDLADLLAGNFIATGSVLFRRSAYSGLPPWMDGERLIDWPLFVSIALHGRLLMLPEVMGAYRVHAQGVWSTQPSAEKRLEMGRAMENLIRTVPMDRVQRTIARKTLARRRLALAWDFIDRDPRAARSFARGSLRARVSPALLGAQLFAVIATHLPSLADGLRRMKRVWRRLGLGGGGPIGGD